jgi:hypothetical protein
MKTRSVLATLALCLVASVVQAADSPHMGAWKLNETKSKLADGVGTSNSIVYEAAGESVKITIDGVDATGKPTHSEWTGKFDGKEYPVTGDATSDTRSYTRVDDQTLAFSAKKAGKETLAGQSVVSADGKARTVTAHGTDAKGQKFEVTAVYDKQ